MHLWPTKNLRDSFKVSYLRKLEWNYRRMEKEQQSSTQQKLLDAENQNQNQNKTQVDGDTSNHFSYEAGVVASLCHELLLVLSCCYCCFCCGACVEEK